MAMALFDAPDAPAETAPEPTPEPTPAPVVEAAPAAPTPPAEPEVDHRFQRYAEKEAELGKARRELEALNAQIDERQKRIERFERFEQELLDGDPLAALEAIDVKFEDLAKGAAAGRGLRPNRKQDQAIAEVKAEIERLKQEQQTSYQRQLEEAAHLEVRREVGARSPLLSSMPDAVERVIGHARRHASEGRPVNYETVIADAEKEVLSFVEKVLSVESVRNRFLPQSPAKQEAQPQQAGARTLTNSQATSVTKRVDQPNLDELSDQAAIDQMFANRSIYLE